MLIAENFKKILRLRLRAESPAHNPEGTPHAARLWRYRSKATSRGPPIHGLEYGPGGLLTAGLISSRGVLPVTLPPLIYKADAEKLIFYSSERLCSSLFSSWQCNRAIIGYRNRASALRLPQSNNRDTGNVISPNVHGKPCLPPFRRLVYELLHGGLGFQLHQQLPEDTNGFVAPHDVPQPIRS